MWVRGQTALRCVIIDLIFLGTNQGIHLKNGPAEGYPVTGYSWSESAKFIAQVNKSSKAVKFLTDITCINITSTLVYVSLRSGWITGPGAKPDPPHFVHDQEPNEHFIKQQILNTV